MRIYQDNELEDYKKNSLLIKDTWKNRNFVSIIRSYFMSIVEKIEAVSGLRGTGKTVGVLQAAEGLDPLYILAQKGEEETGQDYIEVLRNTDKKNIIIDEYGWIRDREELDKFLLTGVQNGKRICITGTESITLDFLSYGALNHRVSVVHTTMFTYLEYLRIYGKIHSKAVCREYLTEGGVFREYAIQKFDSMKAYIEDAIVENLSGYLKDEIDMEEARTLTYSILYKAICPSNLSSVPTLRSRKMTVENFLDTMGVNAEIEINRQSLNRTAEIFEQIGLITRIKNLDEKSDLKEQYYIANPSLTCQLIKAAYAIEEIDDAILGHVFESCVLTELSQNKLSEHELWFLNTKEDKEIPDNLELDGVITDREREIAYLFECKYSENPKTLHNDATILSENMERLFFDGTDILARFVIYNGKPTYGTYPTGDVLFVPADSKMIDNYFEVEKNRESIRKQAPEIQINHILGELSENSIWLGNVQEEHLKNAILAADDETFENEIKIVYAEGTSEANLSALTDYLKKLYPNKKNFFDREMEKAKT